MTVALLAQWGSQPPGTLFTSDSVTEAAMVTAKVATANLAGAVAWVPPGNSPGSNPTPFTNAEAAAIRAAVSGAGILPASNYTYESSGAFRLIGYTRGGIAHSITYPTSTTALITSAQGYQRSITLDASGRTMGVV